MATRAASAGLIFDDLAAAGGPSAITGTVGPVGFFSFGAELSFARDVRITGFSLLNSIGYDGQLRFVIYDRPGTDPLYFGDAVAFSRDDAGPTYKSSGALDFTFRAGSTYALGAISSVGMAMPYGDPVPVSVDGITATGRDPNFIGNIAGTPSPRYIGAADVQGFVRLYDDAATPLAVPEPSSLALAGCATILVIGAAAGRRWRRRA